MKSVLPNKLDLNDHDDDAHRLFALLMVSFSTALEVFYTSRKMLSGLNGTSDSDRCVFLFTLLRSFRRLRRSPNGILHPSLVLVNGQLTPHSPSPPWPLLRSHPLSSISIPCPTTWCLSCRNCSDQPPPSLRNFKPLSNLLPRRSTPSNLGFSRCITTSQHPSHQRRVSLSRRTFQFRRRSAASARKLAIVLEPSGRAYPICLFRGQVSGF